MTDATQLTPAEIDTELARIWEAEQKARHYLKANKRYLDRERSFSNPSIRQLAHYEQQITLYETSLAALRAEAAPYEAEFVARGGWTRYFLVTNSNGHVHRERNCITCFDTTQYGWLPELSDCDEAAMIVEFGEKACTVCFPNAPTNPAFHAPGRRDAAAKAERAAEKAARQAVKDAKSLAPELQFRDSNDWKVTTLAGAKTALREATYTSVIAGTSADYNNYYLGKAATTERVITEAIAALRAKGLNDGEIEIIVERAEKKARKENGL